jgi:hypothetical protein
MAGWESRDLAGKSRWCKFSVSVNWSSQPETPRPVPRKEPEGGVFAYVIQRGTFQLKFLRLLPLARIRLDEVRYIRARSSNGVGGLIAELFSRGGRCVYWPHSQFFRSSDHNFAYVIGMQSGVRVFVRLGTGFHYKLRAAMGRAREAKVFASNQAEGI